MCVCVCVGGCVSVCMCGCAEHITKCIIYKKHSISCQWETQKRKLAQTGWLVLRVTAGLKKGKISYIEIIAVCSEIHTKHINTLCGQNVELLNVKLVVHIVTTGLQRVKYLL